MKLSYVLTVIAAMAAVSYLPRMLPLAIFRKRIQNVFLQSFLQYMPYAVLSAMVFPEVFGATASLVSAIAGVLTAVYLSYRGMGLLPVALGATAVVFLVERLAVLF